jgi:hypothetical protein
VDADRNGAELIVDAAFIAHRVVSQSFDAVLARNIREGKKPMTKLSAIADRIKAKKAGHDKKADEWAARLDALDKREPEAFAVGDAVIAEREADLSGMEQDLRTLSNLPLAGSGGSQDESRG